MLGFKKRERLDAEEKKEENNPISTDEQIAKEESEKIQAVEENVSVEDAQEKPIEEENVQTERVISSEEEVASASVEIEDIIEEKEEAKQMESVAEEKKQEQTKTEEKSSFDLARALGKTEDGLKAEFYAYQIRELMAKVGKIAYAVDFSSGAEKMKDLIKYGTGSVCVTPLYFERCREFENKVGKGKIRFSTVIDYPNGESSIKAQIADVKNAVRYGLDKITVTVPRYEVLSCISGIKNRLNKLSRVAKKGFGYGIICDGNEENLKKALKLLEGVKAERIVLITGDLDVEKVVLSIKLAIAVKGKKQVYVYTNLGGAEDVSIMIENKADGVYTASANEVAEKLCEKFGIKM